MICCCHLFCFSVLLCVCHMLLSLYVVFTSLFKGVWYSGGEDVYSVHHLDPMSVILFMYIISWLTLGEINWFLYSTAIIIKVEVAFRVQRTESSCNSPLGLFVLWILYVLVLTLLHRDHQMWIVKPEHYFCYSDGKGRNRPALFVKLP